MTQVTCPVCGHSFEGAGASGLVVPAHGWGWKSCPGTYTQQEASK